jgi:hypothetical protein
VNRRIAVLVLVAACGGASTPAPRAATPIRLRPIANGAARIVGLVDPDAGFVVRDDDGIVRACGAALPAYLDALDEALATAEPPTCAPLLGRTVCSVHAASPIDYDEPNLALVFAGTPPRLEAAIWKAYVTSGQVARVLRREVAPCAATTAAPAVAAATVTRRLIRQLADGEVPWSDVIDADGVAFVTYRSGETEPPETRAAQRLCGDAAATALAGRADRLRADIAADEIFVCTRGPRPTCTVGEAGEWAQSTRFYFRTSADGTLALDAVADINSAYPPYDTPVVIADLRARTIGERCPAR